MSAILSKKDEDDDHEQVVKVLREGLALASDKF